MVQEQMKILLMRGLPGCGKSTWVAKRPEPKIVCSADDALITDGVYKHDPIKVAEGHDACLNKYVDCLRGILVPPKGEPYEVIVDNTNTGALELAPYVQLAIAHKIPYEIVYVLCSVELSLKRNTHSVPALTILNMSHNLTERLPPWWKVKVICQEDLHVQS